MVACCEKILIWIQSLQFGVGLSVRLCTWKQGLVSSTWRSNEHLHGQFMCAAAHYHFSNKFVGKTRHILHIQSPQFEGKTTHILHMPVDIHINIRTWRVAEQRDSATAMIWACDATCMAIFSNTGLRFQISQIYVSLSFFFKTNPNKICLI